jgi:predicted adenylyl cyclase CyaB
MENRSWNSVCFLATWSVSVNRYTSNHAYGDRGPFSRYRCAAAEEMVAAAGAVDTGEVLLNEVIFYDPEQRWAREGRLVRLRSGNGKPMLAYKHHTASAIDGAREIELAVSDAGAAEKFLEAVGLKAFRHQQKKRHTFRQGTVVIDIDTWPRVPTYVELEGPSRAAVMEVARALELDWSKAVFDDARKVLEGCYGIPIGQLRWFTLDRYEQAHHQ